MKLFLRGALLVFSVLAAHAELSPADLTQIGQKVWQNECAGTIEGLTSWNAGENFASLGIGHFIWYPKDQRGPFEESFPAFTHFMVARGEAVPDWARGTCPWDSRADFQRDMHGPRMLALRAFLKNSIGPQTEFLAQRMRQSLPKMSTAAPGISAKITQYFKQLNETSRGTFALIDYVNFKGEGTLATERYHGEGWGLLQVLEDMNGGSVRDFAEAARSVLVRRVRNAPPERHEERWLPGWINRVESYAR